jgi:hypothetical protein
MDYITDIYNIIKPPGTINIINNQIIIEYLDIRFVMSVINIDTQIQISSTNYLSFHMLRLIINKLELEKNIWIETNITIDYSTISEFFIGLKEIFESNYYDYCTICAIKQNNHSNYITTCLNPQCVTKSYHYPINNKISDLYKKDSNTMILLFQIFLSAFTHPKVEKIIINLPKIYSISDILTLGKQIPQDLLSNNLNDIIKIISTSDDDYNLWLNLNNNLVYALIINAISDNYYSIYSYKDLVNFNYTKFNIIKDDQILNNNDIEFFNINYSTEIENQIKAKLDHEAKYYYLYHGSRFYCWYSIIKNGLKVMSGTELMSSGASYGNGIYFSDKLTTSYQYTLSSGIFSYYMIGLFQIIENPNKYKKTENIFVIPDEKILILRTLIKINKINLSDYAFTQMDNYFIKYKPVDKIISDENLITLTNKRLSAELKLIEKNSEKYKVTHYSNEKEKPWKMDLYVKDQIYNMELYFHNYPLFAPLLKMENFPFQTKGIIDCNFKINLPILEVGKWNISNKLVEVLDIIWIFLNSSY